MKKLHSIQGVILDLDGVIWRGEQLMVGVHSFLDVLHNHSLPYIFASNNPTKTPYDLCQKAHRLGFEIREDQIITSAQAAVNLLCQRFQEGTQIYIIGEVGIREAIVAAQFQITPSADHAQAVVVSLDRELSWDKMAEAAYAIENSAIFIGTNSDPSFPTERGFAPGNGAILNALEVTTGVAPIVVGKPEPFLFLNALDFLGTKPEHTLVIGDRLTTDIQGGINARMMTALILTGVTSREDFAKSTIHPDFVYDTLDDLTNALQQELKT